MSSQMPTLDGTAEDLRYNIIKTADDGSVTQTTHYVAYREAIILPATSGSYDGPQNIVPVLITDGDGAAKAHISIYGEHLFFEGGSTYIFRSRGLKIAAKSISVYGEGKVTFDLHGLDGQTYSEDIKPMAPALDGRLGKLQVTGQQGQAGYDGGSGYPSGSLFVLASSVKGKFVVNLHGGNGSAGRGGGTGGNGGRGFDGRQNPPKDERYLSFAELQVRYRGGDGGVGGSGGNGGDGAAAGHFEAIIPTECNSCFEIDRGDGHAGTGGAGGDGGAGGASGKFCYYVESWLGPSTLICKHGEASYGATGGTGMVGCSGKAPNLSKKKTIFTPFNEHSHLPFSFPPDFLQMLCDRLRFEYHILSAATDLSKSSTYFDSTTAEFCHTLSWLLAVCPNSPPLAPVGEITLSRLWSNVRESILNMKYCVNLGVDIWGRRLTSIDTLFFPFYSMKEKLEEARHIEHEYRASKNLSGVLNKERLEKANAFASLVQNEKDLDNDIIEAGIICQQFVEKINQAKSFVDDTTCAIRDKLEAAKYAVHQHVEWNGWGATLALGAVLVAIPETIPLLLGSVTTVLSEAELNFDGIKTGGGEVVQKNLVLRKITAVGGSVSEIRTKMTELFSTMKGDGSEGLEMISIDGEKFTELCDNYLDAIGADGPLRESFQNLRTQSDALNKLIYSYNEKLIQLHKLHADRTQASLKKQVLQTASNEEDEDYRKLHLLRYFYASTYTEHKMSLIKELTTAAAGVRALTFTRPDYLKSWVNFACFGAVTVDCLLESWYVLRAELEKYQKFDSMNKMQSLTFKANIDSAFPFALKDLKLHRKFFVALLPNRAVKEHWIDTMWKEVRLEGLQVFLDGAKPFHPDDDAKISMRIRSMDGFVIDDTFNRRRTVSCPEIILPFSYYTKDHVAACKPVNPTSAQFQLDDPKNSQPFRQCLISPYTTWMVEVADAVDVSEVTGVKMEFMIQARTTQGKL